MEFTGIGEPVNSANSGEAGSAFWGSRFEVVPLELCPSWALQWSSQEKGAQDPDWECLLGFSSATSQYCDLGSLTSVTALSSLC